jgi:acetyltransferase-like isoleucine patch superfamily enzyme
VSTQTSTSDAAAVLAEIRVPRETVNDDIVTIQDWHVAHGDEVRPKQLVVSIETSKAVLEVEADAAGFVEIIHAKGAEVPIGELIGRVLSSAPARPTSEPPASGGAPSASPRSAANGSHASPRSGNRLRDRMESRREECQTTTAGDPPPDESHGVDACGHVLPERVAAALVISKKAQALINEHQLDAATIFAGMGLIREIDVIRYLESRVEARQKAEPAPASPATLAKAEPAAPAASPEIEPRAAAATVNSAYSTKPRGLFGDAAASAKDRGNKSVVWLAWNYFWRNWLLGNLARWAPRGVILPIHRMRGVKMGQDVFIDPTAIIETAFPENITIGNDVRITAGCVIMSHIKAPHYLRETGLVPVVLKPVVLEDHCFIGVNSVIMPGVTVGKASVVASGSVVVTNVPPYTMVQGNPAKVIKHFPKPGDQATERRSGGGSTPA